MAVPLPMREGLWWRGGGARKDVNNASRGMRLVRSQGGGNLKAFVFVTQIRKALAVLAGKSEPAAERWDNTTFFVELGPEKEAAGAKVMERGGKPNKRERRTDRKN